MPCSPCPCNLMCDSNTCSLTSAPINATPQLLFINRKPFNSVKSAGNSDRYKLVYWRREMDGETLTEANKGSSVRLGSQESISRFTHYKVRDFRFGNIHHLTTTSSHMRGLFTPFISEVTSRFHRWNMHTSDDAQTLLKTILLFIGSRASVFAIATGCRLDNWGVGVRVPVGSRISFSPRRPDRLGAHTASYPMGTWGSFPRGKATGAWSWPFTSNYCRDQENVDLYIQSSIRLHGVALN
jgi:hypothetical protein